MSKFGVSNRKDRWLRSQECVICTRPVREEEPVCTTSACVQTFAKWFPLTHLFWNGAPMTSEVAGTVCSAILLITDSDTAFELPLFQEAWETMTPEHQRRFMRLYHNSIYGKRTIKRQDSGYQPTDRTQDYMVPSNH